MTRIISRLAQWLTRAEKARATAFSQLTTQLQADSAAAQEYPVPVTLFRETWHYVVLELASPGGTEPMKELTHRLLAVAPASAEFTFVTHTLPVDSVRTHNIEESSQGRLAQLLQPTPERIEKRIRSYLLVRALFQKRNWIEPLCQSLHQANTPARVLDAAQAAELLQNWCGPRLDASTTDEWGCQLVNPLTPSRHPLQTLRFDAQIEVESWEAVTLRISKEGSGFEHRASSSVLKGYGPGVRKARARRIEVYSQAGFSTAELSQDRQQVGIWPALPWLQPLNRTESQHTEKILSIDEASRCLPLPLSRFDTASVSERAYLLAVHNNLGAVTHLCPQQSYGLNHTLVMGTAGSGLTYLGNAILAAHLRGGGQAWALRQQPAPIFDEVAEGHVVNLDRDSQFSVNPLSGLEFTEDLWNVQPVLVSWLAMLASLDSGTSLDPGHDDWCRYWLTQALEKAWSSARENLGLAHVLDELDYLGPPAQEISQRIRSTVKNMPSSWFEGVSSTQSTVRYVSVSPAELDTPEQEVVAATVLVLHYRAIVKTPRAVPKLLLIDEAGILDRNAAQGVLMLVLRSLRAENAVAVICEHPFPAGREDQSPLERVLDEYCDNKILTSTVYYHCWRDRLVKCLGYEPQVARRHNNNSSRFLWVQEAYGRASMLELELSPEAQVAFSARPWQHFSYKEARTNGVPVMDALKQGALARAPYEKGTLT